MARIVHARRGRLRIARPEIQDIMARHIFVVSRSHRDLYEFLAKQFVDDSNVRVIYDRRAGERRQESLPAGLASDRRYHADRRSRPEVDEELKSRSHAIITLDD